MKQTLPLLALLAASPWLQAQTPVPVGAGSYASFPPRAAAAGPLRDFVYSKPLYVARSKKNGPIPTNDWWTDLLVRGKDAGLLWVYPLVADPDPNGLNLNFPNSINVNVPSTAAGSGGGYDMVYGGNMRVTAAGYTPSTAQAESWSDWGLVMSLPDTTTGKKMTVSMAHGVPFVWVETQGISPQFNFEKDASYLAADGTPLTLPTRSSFVVNTDGRYFGVHVAPGSTVELRGQQSVTIDLGSRRNISSLRLVWETAFASAYDVQVSDDKVSWQRAYSTTTSTGGTENITALTAGTAGRYVRLLLNKRGTNFGYSLYEMQVFDGSTLVSQNRPVEVTSTQPTGGFVKELINDGNLGSRWASDAAQQPQLVLTPGATNSYFVVSALNATTNQAAGQRLTAYEAYAYNKVTDTQVQYAYDPVAGKVNLTWRLTTQDLRNGQTGGATLQGFLPHLYQNAAHSLAFTSYDYLSPRGTLKTVAGTSFPFSYDFQGVIPSYTAPVSNAADANPYDAAVLSRLVTAYAQNSSNRADTYFGGKDLVLQAKYALLAKQLNHPSAAALQTQARTNLVNWLTYQAGESSRYFARYDRWKALIGFDSSFGSEEFVDNHFHYGYFTLACAIYGMVDPTFLQENQYGGMARLIAKQYANWDKADQTQPWMRTFDPWVGHSYAGGVSSGNGNNQESSSEAMQSWIGLFLLGDALNDPSMRAAGAFGYTSEAAASLEYWFDWKQLIFPAAYAAKRRMGAILSNQGLGHITYFGDQEKYVHGIEYLPVNPGLTYLARDTAWARREYNDLLRESRAVNGYASELDFQEDDWSHVALGFKYMSDPKYVTRLLADNLRLPTTDARYIMDAKEVAGITYFYAHAQQNLGYFSSKFHTNFPTSSVFERNGAFTYAVAYNPSASPQTCTVYNAQGGIITSAVVPARTLLTFPTLGTPPTTPPTACTNQTAVNTVASSALQPARNATDGNANSRWESEFSDPQDLTVDYGRVIPLSTVTIVWERASARDYRLLGSVDGSSWQELAARTNMPVSTDAAADYRRTDVLSVSGSYRYLRMVGTARTTVWGYSIFELTTCGGSSTAARTALATTGEGKLTDTTTPLLVWPNPAQNKVHVAGAKPGQLVQVLDVQGRVVLQQTVSNDAPLELALPAELARGLYLVRCGGQSSRLTLE